MLNLKNEKFVVWRWANPSKRFKPTKNRSWGDLKMESHNQVVFTGLNPTDWIWLFSDMRARARGKSVLHKITLTREQASLCVVAEQEFRPSEEEIQAYLQRTGRFEVGSLIGYSMEKYEKSFIPLPKYKGEYNLPEVLIPFEVEAKVDWIKTYLLIIKMKYFSPTLRFTPRIRNQIRNDNE